MKECCKVGDTPKTSKIKKWVTRGFWFILLLVIMGLVIADAIG